MALAWSIGLRQQKKTDYRLLQLQTSTQDRLQQLQTSTQNDATKELHIESDRLRFDAFGQLRSLFPYERTFSYPVTIQKIHKTKQIPRLTYAFQNASSAANRYKGKPNA